MSKSRRKGAIMSGNIAPTKDSMAEPCTATATGTVPPTGYRVSILPSALEVSARLATAEELQVLVKVLQANAAILASATNKAQFNSEPAAAVVELKANRSS
jgi:hypothetical protein